MTTKYTKHTKSKSVVVATMKRIRHKCCVCDHKWENLDPKLDPKKVEIAAKSNGDGPYCGMCLHLEMAERYAIARGFSTIEGGLKKWKVMRAQKSK